MLIQESEKGGYYEKKEKNTVAAPCVHNDGDRSSDDGNVRIGCNVIKGTEIGSHSQRGCEKVHAHGMDG